MDLLDKLRALTETFPPSHMPSISEVGPIVGALVAYSEHGDKLLQAAEQDDEARQAGEPATHVHDLLSPPEDQPADPAAPSSSPESPAPVAPSITGSATPPGPGADADADADRLEQADKDAEIASLRQQLATAQAVNQRTTIDVTGQDTPPPAPAAAPPAAPSPIDPTPGV